MQREREMPATQLPERELAEDARLVFLHHHRHVMFVWDLGWLFVVIFAGLLLWEVIYAQCASSSTGQQILVFSYPLIGSLALGVVLLLLDYGGTFALGVVGDVVGNVAQWVAVASLANFLNVVIMAWSPSGSLDNTLLSLGLIVAVFIAMVCLYFTMRLIRDTRSSVAHQMAMRYTHASAIDEEADVKRMLTDYENELYSADGVVKLWGMPLISRFHIFSHPRDRDSSQHR